jgi:hypothetical protein
VVVVAVSTQIITHIITLQVGTVVVVQVQHVGVLNWVKVIMACQAQQTLVVVEVVEVVIPLQVVKVALV